MKEHYKSIMTTVYTCSCGLESTNKGVVEECELEHRRKVCAHQSFEFSAKAIKDFDGHRHATLIKTCSYCETYWDINFDELPSDFLAVLWDKVHELGKERVAQLRQDAIDADPNGQALVAIFGGTK